MAQPCAFQLPGGGTCGSTKKTAPVHSRHHPQYHKYEDATKPGISPIGKSREAYQQTEQHQTAYAGAAGSVCLPGAAGMPGKCSEDITPHHVFAVSAAGGRKVAEDGWPVIACCSQHNGDMESKRATRVWAETHTFVWNVDGNEYPFRINAAMARRIKADREERNPVRI